MHRQVTESRSRCDAFFSSRFHFGTCAIRFGGAVGFRSQRATSCVACVCVCQREIERNPVEQRCHSRTCATSECARFAPCGFFMRSRSTNRTYYIYSICLPRTRVDNPTQVSGGGTLASTMHPPQTSYLPHTCPTSANTPYRDDDVILLCG